MTPQEENDYLTQLLTRMARQPAGSNITELGLKPLHRNDYFRLAHRLQEDKLATQTDPDYLYHLALTAKGMQVAALPGGYADFIAQGVAKAWQEVKKEEEARLHVRLATGAAIASALAAAVAIGVSVWPNDKQEKADAKVEALTKRVDALEAQAKQRQHP